MSDDETWASTAPKIAIEVLEDRRSDHGFLRVRRLRLRNDYLDGTHSDPYAYDLVERDAIDAVAILLVTRDGRVCLRSSLRPPLWFRPSYPLPIAEPVAQPVVWEVPAGLIERDEIGVTGLRACAARETEEEVGVRIPAAQFSLLGQAALMTPGVIAEKIHFLWAEVDPNECAEPAADGTPVEERAAIAFVPLADALAACDDGRIADMKTEVALSRWARRHVP